MSNTMTRPQLGNFSSIVCFKYVILGMENALGEKATAISLIAAGRARGKKLAQELGLIGQSLNLDDAAHKMSQALGKDGTRLCIIDKIEQEGDLIKVYTAEAVCSAGELAGSPRKCTFTMGAVWGAMEEVMGKRLHGVQTESVLQGGMYDVFEFTPMK